MASVEYITRKNTASFSIKFRMSDGTVADLSDSIVKLLVKKDRLAPDDTAVLAAQWDHPAHNILDVEFTPEQTEALAEGEYWAAVKKYSDAGGHERSFELNNFRIIVNNGVFDD